jgi:competence protein ComFC
MWNLFLSFIFPEECISCKKVGSILCTICLEKIPLYSNDPDRSIPLYIQPTFDYRNKHIKKLIRNLKYSGSSHIADILSEKLYENLTSLASELYQTKGVTDIYLIPIPITSSSRNKRGYNQSEYLIQGLQKHTNNSPSYEELFGVLCKKEDYTSQVSTRTRGERFKNIKNSMYVSDPSKIIGKDIVLVDDVVTTGATIREARKVLLQAGARSVHAITISH